MWSEVFLLIIFGLTCKKCDVDRNEIMECDVR